MTNQTWQHPTDYTNFYENDDEYNWLKLTSNPSDNIINDENEI